MMGCKCPFVESRGKYTCKVIGTVYIMKDITERKRLEEKQEKVINDLKKQLKETKKNAGKPR